MRECILVTGGAGFIGSNFVGYILENYFDTFVVVLDKLTYAGNMNNLSGVMKNHADRFLFVRGDICDTPLVELLIRQYSIHRVVNFAAESHVDRSIADADIFIKTNVEGTFSLLKACRNCWQENGREWENTRFHQVSTDEVYGTLKSVEDVHFTEEHPYRPNSPYASSKASADLMVRAFHQTYGLDVTVTHGSNTYGFCQHPEKLVPMTFTRALNGEEIPVYGNGEQVREWIFVTDHCRAIDFVMRNGRSGEHYNIDGEPLTNNVMISGILSLIDERIRSSEELCRLFPNAAVCHGGRSKDLIRHVADRPGHDICYAVNAGKLMNELGFRRETDLTPGLSLTFDWYLKEFGR
ncbi:dTDP-glucose 4,6-dehydratase [Ruminobacter sp. RM87]|jgi:dTDP-glucose 4,6-dehydratase|uniref:dTDP-glucose 4,6-dehydratase n=1 Tax=Ruminobacter sp. RM87 TaxID=1200567 RepID=UPI0004E23819|nr:dTDP-glucose 4,6-dehydratase [Ruminobacter sp. RM87]